MQMSQIKMNLGKRFCAALFILGLWLPLQAMDRWSALSEIESGNNDRAVGRAGEISRYQIKPKIWQRYAPEKADWEKPAESLPVVKEAMQARCKAFERSFHRPPTDFEFYVLWNAPAQIRRPTKSVADRAQRFSNLVNADETQGSPTVAP
jgi:hypothetical protein